VSEAFFNHAQQTQQPFMKLLVFCSRFSEALSSRFYALSQFCKLGHWVNERF